MTNKLKIAAIILAGIFVNSLIAFSQDIDNPKSKIMTFDKADNMSLGVNRQTPDSKDDQDRLTDYEAEELSLLMVESSLAIPGSSLEEGLAKKVSLDLRGMSVIDIIKFLSVKGNLNIVTSKSVGGRITLFLKDVMIRDVLDVILLTNDLACKKKDNIITIMTNKEYTAIYGNPYIDKRSLRMLKLEYADAASLMNVLTNIKSDIGKIIIDTATATIVLIDVPQKLDEMERLAKTFDIPTINRVIPMIEEVFELSYAKAKDIEGEVFKSLTEGIGSIRVDEKTNKIIVKDLPHNMESIKNMIKEFDSRTKQVLVKAKIVEITLTDNFYMGVDWATMFTDMHDMVLEGTFPFSSTGASSLAMNVGTIAADKYEIAIDMIKTVGKVSIVSSPHIAICNNEEAKFMVGSREAYVTSTITAGDVSTTTSESVEFIEVGTNLYITPTISKDGFIKMKIKPEVSSVREWFETSEGNRIPVVDTSNVETEVLVKDGVTVVIAGLIKESKTKTMSKIPILGNIPLIGLLFRTLIDTKEKKELVMFITPQIISGEDDVSTYKIRKKRKPPKEVETEVGVKYRKPYKIEDK